jgi:hypothetical protein
MVSARCLILLNKINRPNIYVMQLVVLSFQVVSHICHALQMISQ